MTSRVVDDLRAAIDELAGAEIVGLSQREDLAALWCELARLEAQFARRLGEFDRSVEWSVDGARSAASWLIAKGRAGSGDAHHRVKVARQIAGMPVAWAAWESGAINSRHVDALTRIRHSADADEYFASFEPALVDVARTDRPEDVAATGQQWRDALDSHLNRDGANRRDDKDHEHRKCNFSKSLHGVGFLNGRLYVEGTEILDTALKRSYQQHHAENDPRTPAQQRADALVELGRFYLDHQGRGANRPHLIVTVDAETLSGEAVGRCETISGYRISPDTARRLACDSIVQRILVNAAGVSLEMGRAERTFTPDQYRAIMTRDGGCRFPGCTAKPAECEAHHAMIHWEDGGPTDISNGLGICKGAGHHRMIHEGGWTIEGDPNGEVTFYDLDGNPQGSSRPRNQPPPIPTCIGNEITRALERARALSRSATAA
jgi:Domain of unknown function (DUF222)